MTNTSPNLAESVNKEKLMTDVKTVLSDAETLLKQAASSSGEKAAELRERGMGMLRQAKEKAQDRMVASCSLIPTIPRITVLKQQNFGVV